MWRRKKPWEVARCLNRAFSRSSAAHLSRSARLSCSLDTSRLDDDDDPDRGWTSRPNDVARDSTVGVAQRDDASFCSIFDLRYLTAHRRSSLSFVTSSNFFFKLFTYIRQQHSDYFYCYCCHKKMKKFACYEHSCRDRRLEINRPQAYHLLRN